MGMGVSSARSLSSGAGVYQQQRQSFNQLSQALQSGNLDVAKQAFSALSTNSPSAANSNSPLAKLGQALQSGDVGAAQAAFASLRSGHHHHQEAASVNSGVPATPLATSGSVGTKINTAV